MNARLLVCLTLAAAGCSSTGAYLVPAKAVHLVHGDRAPAIDRLLEDVYGGALSLDEAEERVNLVLQDHPNSGPAHEVAGYLAILRGATRQAAQQFLDAALDVDAPTELYLQNLPNPLLARDEPGFVRVLSELAAHHPRPDGRAAASYVLARLLRRQGHLEQARALTSRMGFIRDWLLIGPFDNDQGKGFLTTFPPERAIEPATELTGRLVPLRWRELDRTSELGTVILNHYVYPDQHSVAYLATSIFSAEERTVVLRIKTGQALRAWCNDELIVSEETVHEGELDNVRARVKLGRGWNQLLIKSANRGASYWTLAARVTDEHGEPAQGLKLAAEAHPHAHTSNEVHVSFLPESLDAVTPPARQQLLRAQLLAHAGRPQEALDAIEGLNSNNVLWLFFGALNYWDNDQLGKTIDLLNQGIKATDGHAAAFLVKRARYYAQKRLYEKAQGDLEQAIALQHGFPDAQLDLADLDGQRAWPVEQCRRLAGVVAAWPDSLRATLGYGRCLTSRQLYDRARRELVRADRIAPGDGSALEYLVQDALRTDELASARTLLEREHRFWPTNAAALVDLGELSRRRGDAAGAAARYREAIAQLPGWARPYELLGDLELEAGHSSEALVNWHQALDRDPNRTILAQRIEQIQPTSLGTLARYAPGDEIIDRALSRKVAVAPGAQVISRLDDEITEINSDGGARRLVTQVDEAVTEQGRDSLTSHTLPSSGQLKILQAYALSKRGERQEASSIRGNIVRFRSLEVGSKMVLQFIHYEPPHPFLPNHYSSIAFFQGLETQFEESRWVVMLARGRTLNVEIDGDVTHQTSSDGELQVHTFSAGAVPPLVKEMLMPPPQDVLRRVFVSTVSSWDEYVRWERALLDDIPKHDRKVVELAESLTRGVSEPRKKLDQLYHYVAQKIRYQQDYEYTIAGVKPHGPSMVVERGYGDCKDKALLLIQLANAVGLQARYALLRTVSAGRMQRAVPNQQFNHVIVYLPVQPGIERAQFLDPTATDLDIGALGADDQGATSLVLDIASGKYEFIDIPVSPASANREQHKIRIEIGSTTQAKAVDELSISGSAGMMMRRGLRNRERARKWIESEVSGMFSGATLTDMSSANDDDIWKPLGLHLEIDVSNAIQAQDNDRFRIKPPALFPLAGAASLARRQTPLWLSVPGATVLEMETLLPEGYEVVRLPGEISVKHACFSITRRAHAEGRKVVVKIEAERSCTEIAVGDYAGFRGAVQSVLRQLDDEIVFGKLQAGPPGRKAGGKVVSAN